MLTRLTKRDVLAQLASVRQMAKADGKDATDWKVRIPRNRTPPALDTVCNVETDEDGTICLLTLSETGMALAGLLARDDPRHFEMTLAGIEKALSESSADGITISSPSGRLSCVCKVLAATFGDERIVFLFPGPMDIEKVNEEIAEHRRTHMCPTPELDCERCERLSGCEILEEAEHVVKARRERKTTDDNAEAND